MEHGDDRGGLVTTRVGPRFKWVDLRGPPTGWTDPVVARSKAGPSPESSDIRAPFIHESLRLWRLERREVISGGATTWCGVGTGNRRKVQGTYRAAVRL